MITGHIGFVNPIPIWEGPDICHFSSPKNHTKTVMYSCPVGDRYFDFYVPHMMLPGFLSRGRPDRLLVAIMRAKTGDAAPLFTADEEVLAGFPEIFEYNQPRVNSTMYTTKGHDRYRLYVPDLFLNGLKTPDRLLVQTAVERSV